MKEDIRWKQRFSNFEKALNQLTDAIALSKQRPLNPLELQGVIQGFEYVQELAWNTLKDFLENEGIQGIIGSKGAVREAFKRGLIQDGDIWMDMIEKRNLSTHTYNEETAIVIVDAIFLQYYQCFLDLQTTLRTHY